MLVIYRPQLEKFDKLLPDCSQNSKLLKLTKAHTTLFNAARKSSDNESIDYT